MFQLCVITDGKQSRGRPLLEVVAAAIEGGADAIQLREKEATSQELYQMGLDLRKLTAERGVILIINDRPDIALAVDADGVHVGQDDLPAVAARKLLGPGKIVGVSASRPHLALKAQEDGADYVGIGAIYSTTTKELTAAPRGPEFIEDFTGLLSIPFVALGGITSKNIEEVVRAGARSVAVCAAVVSAPDVSAAARELIDAITRAEPKGS